MLSWVKFISLNIIMLSICYYGAALVTQMVKNLPAVQEAQVRSLGQEDPLEKGMATHSSILAWRIPWTEKPGGLQSIELLKELDTTERLTLSHLDVIVLITITTTGGPPWWCSS